MSDPAPERAVRAQRGFAITRHRASHGLRWLVLSYAMFRQHRLAWIGLLLGYYVALVVVEVVPLVGVFLGPMLKPVLSVGFLAAAWSQERGGKPTFPMLFRGFRTNVAALLPLGLVFMVGISLALAATALIDGGQLLDLLYGRTSSPDEAPSVAAQGFAQTLANPRVQFAMLFGALCAAPTILALWWAPALVVFQDARFSAALRGSLRAALANWRPVVVYAIALFVLGAVLPSLVTLLLALLLPTPLNATITVFVVLPYVAFFVATLHISDYVSYRDVFHAGE
ncbi:MAG TPA: BPSS1780 family membrane protein [Casimicrobiaceae bacterium]|nr:BPSS1780 family membrane protein [Casimicrobiaceae bacterium]